MQHGVLTTALRPLRRAGMVSALASLALVACGGSGSDEDATTPGTPAPPVATQLSGTAAIGAPVAGAAVQVRCAGASTVLESVTNAAGLWQVSTTGQSLPCAVRVSGGNLPAGQALHSAALDFGQVNITPLTDLIIANAAGQLPGAWWGSAGPTDFSALATPTVEKALTQLRSALALPALQNIDPRTVAFTAAPKDAVDDMLEALQRALGSSGISYQTLLNEASKAQFLLSQDFQLTLQTAYHTITVGGPAPGTGTGTGGGTVTVPDTGTTPGAGTTGNYTLTLNVTASGMSLAPITLTNMPKPNTQGEFCDEVNGINSNIGLQQSIPAGTGSLSINSCSFNGSVGQVSATVSITAPVAMTVPYSVTYTYH